MTISERKYRVQLDELIDRSLNEVFDREYDMPEVDDLSQFRYKHAGAENGKNFTTAVASNNFTPIKYGPMNHGWKTVTAVNGMMGWVDRKGRQHPIMRDLGWLDSCSDFSPGRSAIASGMKDGVRYYVYKNGKYEKDSRRFVRTTYDMYGNRQESDDIADGIKNHDGTATTRELISNARSASNPQGTWDPTKLIRYSTQDKGFFMQFVMVWAQHFGDKSQYRTGFNDEDSTYFIDIENGPGVYNAVVELDQGLGSSINVNQIDRETWNQRNKFNGASGRFFEARLRWPRFGRSQKVEAPPPSEWDEDELSAPYQDDNDGQGWYDEPDPEENGGSTYNSADAGDTAQLSNGSIVFGTNIPFDNAQQGQNADANAQQGQNAQQQQQKPNQSFEVETMQVDYYGFINNMTAQWILRIDQGLWLNAEDGTKIGTVKVEPNLSQWNFSLTHNNGNQFNFVIREAELMDSGRGYEFANNIQLFYSTPNTMSKNRGIGYMDIIYTHKMKNDINLFESKVCSEVLRRLKGLNEGVSARPRKRVTLSEAEFRGLLKNVVTEMVGERFDNLDGSAVWDVARAMEAAGLSEEECEMCSALDDSYRVRFSGSEDFGDWDTPPSYDQEPDENDVREVECDINAIPDERVRAAMTGQFRSWLQTAEPDMDFSEGPDPDRFRDNF